MLTLQAVTLKTHQETLLKNLSVTFLPGSIVHLQGENGSGKTTLLKALSGLRKPNEGIISYSGDNINYIAHRPGIKEELKVIEQLKFWASLYDSEILLPSAVFYCNLTEVLENYCYQLSAGNKQKLAIAKLLACNADLWLLDELDSSLDQNNRLLLQNLIITKANNGGIIVFTSHVSFIPSAIKLEVKDFHV